MTQKATQSQLEVRQLVRTLRIIVFSLAMGVSGFLAYAVWIAEPGEPSESPKLAGYMAYFAVACLVAWLFVPGLLFRGLRQQIAKGTWRPQARPDGAHLASVEGQLMAALQTKTIVAAALLEGAGFANTFAFLTERQAYSLVITLLLIAGIASHFPLRFWLDSWLERQQRIVEEERSLGP